MTEKIEYTADLARVINNWRIAQYRRAKKIDRAAVAPAYDDAVNDGLIRCAWVLCHAYAGAHHVPRARVCDRWVEVVDNGNLATADGTTLTRLVIAAHEAAVRLEIGACGPRGVRLMLHPRGRTESISTNHPTLDTALADARKRWAPCPVSIPGGPADA